MEFAYETLESAQKLGYNDLVPTLKQSWKDVGIDLNWKNQLIARLGLALKNATQGFREPRPAWTGSAKS